MGAPIKAVYLAGSDHTGEGYMLVPDMRQVVPATDPDADEHFAIMDRTFPLTINRLGCISIRAFCPADDVTQLRDRPDAMKLTSFGGWTFLGLTFDRGHALFAFHRAYADVSKVSKSMLLRAGRRSFPLVCKANGI
jgi:hypothetical protein